MDEAEEYLEMLRMKAESEQTLRMLQGTFRAAGKTQLAIAHPKAYGVGRPRYGYVLLKGVCGGLWLSRILRKKMQFASRNGHTVARQSCDQQSMITSIHDRISMSIAADRRLFSARSRTHGH